MKKSVKTDPAPAAGGVTTVPGKPAVRQTEFESQKNIDDAYKYELPAQVGSTSPDTNQNRIWQRKRNVFINTNVMPGKSAPAAAGTDTLTTAFSFKAYTRFVYSKNDDRFYGFYRLIKVSSTGRVYEVGVEEREELFKTTLYPPTETGNE